MSKTENECIVMGMSARADRLIGDAMRIEMNGQARRCWFVGNQLMLRRNRGRPCHKQIKLALIHGALPK
jgi:hypothetical protein